MLVLDQQERQNVLINTHYSFLTIRDRDEIMKRCVLLMKRVRIMLRDESSDDDAVHIA